MELTVDSLKELNVGTFGKRFKIHNAIQSLKEETSVHMVGLFMEVLCFCR